MFHHHVHLHHLPGQAMLIAVSAVGDKNGDKYEF
jgi:hypothetical protein